MDKIDKELLNLLQEGLPLSVRPFRQLGKKIGLSENETLCRVNRLKNEGYIRRIGGVFNSHELGFYSTLIAARVNPQKIEEVAEFINSISGVTHNYERNNYYNLWFTLTVGDEAEVDSILNEVAEREGVEAIMKLPSMKLFKIYFKLALK